jgi:hypothetical protein
MGQERCGCSNYKKRERKMYGKDGEIAPKGDRNA